MAKRTIEETFKAIKPKGQGGQKSPAISVGVSSNNSDLSTSLSQAGQQMAQLQSAYQQQASLISANTQAIQGNTSAQSSKSAGSVAGGVASSLFGGLGLLSPLISGIASLFGGNSTPAPLPVYRAPSPVAINAALNAATPNAATPNAATPNAATPNAATPNAATPNAATPNAAAIQNGGPSAQSAAGGFPAPATPAQTSQSQAVSFLTLAAPPQTSQSQAVSLMALAAPPQNGGPSPQSPAGGIQTPNAPQVTPSAPAISQANQSAPAAPQVIVNVTAMDSQSFMDHSTDIANAVREAMLNMHPINGVVATL